MDATVALMVTTSYSYETAYTLYNQLINGKVDNYKNCEKSFKIGVCLYLMGEIGNLYHHYLLRRNRLNNKSNKRYVIPQGGFFRFIWTPHYFFEIISWIGMMVTSRHITFYTVLPSMFAYLFARANTTKKWYQEKFGDECPQREAIIPFIF